MLAGSVSDVCAGKNVNKTKDLKVVLLFLLHVIDLHRASNVLNPTMFTDGTNLFFSHSYIKILFEKINKELTNESDSFNANTL